MDSPVPDGKERFLTAPMIAALAVSTLLLALNYLAFPEFGSFGNENSIQWLISSWNKQRIMNTAGWWCPSSSSCYTMPERKLPRHPDAWTGAA